MESGHDWGIIWAVYLSLLLIGIFYNLLVAWLEKNSYSEGYVSVLVVIGVGITLAGVAVIDFDTTVIVAMAFIFSGFPMIVGSIWRYMERRKNEMQSIVNEVKSDNEAKRLGKQC